MEGNTMKGLLLGLLIASSAQAEMSNNEAIAYCLKEHNYSQENFYQFRFTAAAGCAHRYIAANERAAEQKIKDFLKENPSYKNGKSNSIRYY